MAKHTFPKQTKHTEITWSQLFGYKWGYNLQASQSESLVCIQGLRVILNFRKDRSTRTQVIAIIALLRRKSRQTHIIQYDRNIDAAVLRNKSFPRRVSLKNRIMVM